MITGITIAVLIGFLGISVDLGRLFVVKAELQTAMDSCALAAASGLRPGMNDANSLARARAFGRAPVDPGATSSSGTGRGESVNQVNFQDANLDPQKIEFAFGSRLDDVRPSWTDVNTARYARCSYPLDGVAVYFMRVLGGATVASVGATATATLKESIGPSCIFPVAMCNLDGNTDPAQRWGLTAGQWQRAVEKSNEFGSGRFGWLDLNGNANGSAELKEWIGGEGYCGPVSDELKPGAKQGVEVQWNSRFGVYKKGAGLPSESDSPPDFTGYSYRDLTNENKPADNWAPDGWESDPKLVINAFRGTDQNSRGGATEPNYEGTSASRAAFQYSLNGYAKTATDHAKHGRTRRIVPVPVFDCTSTPGTAKSIKNAFACVLLVHPISVPKDASIEFLGRADEIEACRSAGAVGGSTGSGPLVPVLVQ
ncbi:pilus assembly protein TadG-related protein [Zeimonas arvi]|uniref:pilus assembly protein TadG-related protein n=1 Tax=Zeimonas arvi TaxID=2498847 RepID=UPI00164FDA50|nr:pilus assembly protein TadG-related protein [Zeimonas arvi]